MYLGRVVEIGPTEEIFANPRHPYTKALLAAIPEPDPDRMVPRDLPRGEIPDAADAAAGLRVPPAVPRGRRRLRLGVARPAGARSRSTGCARTRRTTRSRTVVGDLEHLDDPSTSATLGTGASAAVRAILDRMRAEDTDEPLWSGVTSIEDARIGRDRALRAGAVARRCGAPAASTWRACSTPTRARAQLNLEPARGS